MLRLKIPCGGLQSIQLRKGLNYSVPSSRRNISMAGAATDMQPTPAAELAQSIVPATIEDLESIAYNNVVMAKVWYLCKYQTDI